MKRMLRNTQANVRNSLIEITLHALLHAQTLDLAIETTRNDGDVGAVVVCGDECACTEGAVTYGTGGLVDSSSTCVASVEDYESVGSNVRRTLDWKIFGGWVRADCASVDGLEDGCGGKCGREGAQTEKSERCELHGGDDVSKVVVVVDEV
jgi:hypothetical protein